MSRMLNPQRRYKSISENNLYKSMETNFNSKFWKIAGVLVGFAALAVALIQLYIHREKQPALEIKKISEVELTQPLEVAKLSSTYI